MLRAIASDSIPITLSFFSLQGPQLTTGMEARLVRLFERQSTEFKELKESFKELKAENAILRKEILGIRVLAASSDRECMSLMENRTLRELVEEIQYDVKAIKAKFGRGLQYEQVPLKRNFPLENKRPLHDPRPADNNAHGAVEPAERLPAVDIQCKTIKEEREWMKTKFNELVKGTSVSDGATLQGTRLQKISSSIGHTVTRESNSCTIKLSNYLSYAITDPSYNFRAGSKTSGPSKVDPHCSEVFIFQGAQSVGFSYGGFCDFLCSFGISNSLRLTIHSCTASHGWIQLGMAFTPQDVPTDANLHTKLKQMISMPDVWVLDDHKEPLECIVSHGKLFARGHMTLGPFSLIHIEILEVSGAEGAGIPVSVNTKPLVYGKSMRSIITSGNNLRASNLSKITGVIEIANCLNYKLKSRTSFFCTSAYANVVLSEIRPFHVESFSAPDPTTAGTTLCYEIESTDICLAILIRAEAGYHSFVAAFTSIPTNNKLERAQFLAFMKPNGWATHLYKKQAYEEEREQEIQIRNIRASVRMVEDKDSFLKIRVYAV